METSLVLVKKVSFSLFYHLDSNCGKIIPLTTRVPLTTKELVSALLSSSKKKRNKKRRHSTWCLQLKRIRCH